MEGSRSCIMGSVIACVMMGSKYPSFHSDIAPMQLDIVVPINVISPSPAARLERLLRAMDYDLHLPQPSSGSYAICTTRVDLYEHPVSLLI